MKSEEEAHIIEEERMKLEEEGLLMKSEDEVRLVEEERLKYEQ